MQDIYTEKLHNISKNKENLINGGTYNVQELNSVDFLLCGL